MLSLLFAACAPAVPITVQAEPCACFDAAALDARFEGLELEALSWERRPSGSTEELSLRGYTWEQTDEGLWQSPMVGADTFRWSDAGDPYCETWAQTWRAEPHHSWADDYVGEVLPLTEGAYLRCEAILWDWIDARDVPLQSW